MMTVQQTSAPTPPPIPPLPNGGGGTGTAITVVPPPVPVSPDIPREVVAIVAIVFGTIAMVAIVAPVLRGVMRIIERRTDKALIHGPAVAQQLAQLQQSVDALAIEVERISESQRFQAKLMAEKERAAIGEGQARQ